MEGNIKAFPMFRDPPWQEKTDHSQLFIFFIFTIIYLFIFYTFALPSYSQVKLSENNLHV